MSRPLSFMALCCVALCSFMLLDGFAASFTQKRREQAGAKSNRSAVQSQDARAEWLREVAALLQAGRLDEAEPIVRRALAARPEDPNAHTLLGVILDQRGRAAAAEREYREALRLNPKSVSTLANLGVLLARTGRAEQAIQAFESVLREVPDHPQATFNLGLQYAARGDYGRATALFERLNARGPRSFEVLFNLGVVLYHLNRMDEAASALNEAASLAPGNAAAQPLYYLGLTASARGLGEEAVEFWRRALAARPNFPEANFMIGEELRKSLRIEEAKEFYERALAQDPSKTIYYVRLGGVYLLLKLPSQALEIFQRAQQRSPAEAELSYFVGIAARAKGDYAIAETALRKTLSLQPDNFDALAQLGFIMSERGNYREAEALLRRAIALNDKHFYAHYDLGRLLVRENRLEEAIPFLERGAAIKPANAGVHYQLFRLFSRLKRREEAEQQLVIFKRLDEERKLHGRDDDMESVVNESTTDRQPTAPENKPVP